MQPLEIIVKGNSSQANSALQKTQQELAKTAVAAQKTDSSIQTFSRNGATSMFTLTERIKAFQAAAFTEKDRGKITLYNAEIKATEAELAKLSSLGTGSAGAFSGISAGAGKAFSAVRQLAYILPGIGIAGIIGFATEPIIKYISSLFELSDAQKKVIENQKEFNEDVAKDYGKESASLQVLRATIESTLVPMETRLQAIKDLKKEFPGLFDGLTNEQLLTGKVAGAYGLAAAAILRKVRASAAATQIEKIEADKLKILEQAQKDYNATVELSNKIKGPQVLSSGGTGGGGGFGESAAQAKAKVLSLYNIRAKGYNDALKQLQDNENLYLKIAVEGADRTIKIEKEKVEKLKKVRLKADDVEKIKPIFKNVQGFKPEFIIDTKLIIKPTFVLDGGERAALIRYLKEAGIDKIEISVGFKVKLEEASTDQLQEAFNKFMDKVKAFQKMVTETINNIATDVVSGLAGAVATALGGGKVDLPNLFGGLISSVGTQIQALGKSLISSGIQINLAKKAFQKLLANPVASIVVGIGLVALGALLKSQASKQYKGFATGVRNFSGGTALVGERGPELVTLPQGSNVVPNGQLNAMGGNNEPMIADIVIRGTDLVAVFKKATAYNSRNGF